MTCSWLISLFMTFSWLVHVLIWNCVWLANGLLRVCSWLSNLDLSITCSLLVHFLFIFCSSPVHQLYIILSWHAHDLFMTFYLLTICSQLVYEWFFLFLWLLYVVHVLFKIFHDLLLTVGSYLSMSLAQLSPSLARVIMVNIRVFFE